MIEAQLTGNLAPLLRLLQLSSPALPVGGFAYSQGLEYAVEAGWANTTNSVQEWLSLQLKHNLGRLDIPVIYRIYAALEQEQETQLTYWNNYLLASRETNELLLTDRAMGDALARLLPKLSVPFVHAPRYSFVTLFTIAAQYWGISQENAATGFCWSWLENQIAAATKLVPLGQTQAQQLLSNLQMEVPAVIRSARALSDNELGGTLPGMVMASCRHETQYTRLFRS